MSGVEHVTRRRCRDESSVRRDRHEHVAAHSCARYQHFRVESERTGGVGGAETRVGALRGAVGRAPGAR